MLEQGQMPQEPLINAGMAMSCKRLQWRIQGQERALPIGSRSSRRASSHEFVTLGAVPDTESGSGFGGARRSGAEMCPVRAPRPVLTPSPVQAAEQAGEGPGERQKGPVHRD